MRFRQFIESINQYHTDGRGDYNVTRVDAQELADWALANCRGYLQNAKHSAIFRGMESDVLFGRKNTNDFTRVSANTENYYTLWMDNSEVWKGYPKRSKSYICSSSPKVAESFGTVHFVLIPDNAKVAICPGDDLWNSFRPSVDSLDGLMDDLSTAFKLLRIDHPTERHELLDALQDVTIESLSRQREKMEAELKKAREQDEDGELRSFIIRENSVNGLTELIELMEQQGVKNMYAYFTRVINPVKHNFEIQTGLNLNVPFKREVWVQGDVGLVNLEAYTHAENTDPIADLFDKYDLNKKLGL
jgi:hypothetical protein